MEYRKLGEITQVLQKTINPQKYKEKKFVLYSLPGFDNNMTPEKVLGQEINSNKIIIKQGCVLFNKLNLRFKRIWNVSNDFDNMICSTEFIPLIPTFEKINMNYLYYYISSDFFNEDLIEASTGTSNSHQRIKKELLLDKYIWIPDIDIQYKIAKILLNIDKKIELNNRINDNLAEIIKKIYIKWFNEYDFPGADGIMKQTELGKIPQNWSIKKLEEVFFFQEGPGIRNWQYVEENGTKFINIRCIKDDDLYLDKANMISNEEAHGKYKHFMLDEWDIVISTSGTLGKNQIIRKEHLPLCLNTSVIRFKPLNGMENFAYMYNYLISKEFIELLNSMACGSVQKNFGPTHLKQIKLKYPTKDLLKKFSDIVFPMIEKIQKNKTQNISLKQLRDTLVPKLMNGEMDLSKIKI